MLTSRAAIRQPSSHCQRLIPELHLIRALVPAKWDTDASQTQPCQSPTGKDSWPFAVSHLPLLPHSHWMYPETLIFIVFYAVTPPTPSSSAPCLLLSSTTRLHRVVPQPSDNSLPSPSNFQSVTQTSPKEQPPQTPYAIHSSGSSVSSSILVNQ